jgi:aspartate/tyrosine/aromatic aminotransferase
LFKQRGLLPYIDMAYQGLGVGVDEDAYGIRLFSAELPEVLIAVSCSKNFGLYRERTGSRAAFTRCRRTTGPRSFRRSSRTPSFAGRGSKS